LFKQVYKKAGERVPSHQDKQHSELFWIHMRDTLAIDARIDRCLVAAHVHLRASENVPMQKFSTGIAGACTRWRLAKLQDCGATQTAKVAAAVKALYLSLTDATEDLPLREGPTNTSKCCGRRLTGERLVVGNKTGGFSFSHLREGSKKLLKAVDLRER
jgi:hypothetical protein